MFETLTRAKLRACFLDDLGQLIFVVQPGEIGKAIGKKGSNIRRLEGLLKKRIKLVEYSEDLRHFIENLIYPIKAKEIGENEGTVTIKSADLKSRGFLIGRDAKNLRNYENTVKKYFEIKEIRVV